MIALGLRQQSTVQPLRKVKQNAPPSRRRIEVLGKLPVYFKWPPVSDAPFRERLRQCRLLILTYGQKGAAALGIQANTPIWLEIEVVPAWNVMKRATYKFKGVRSRPEGSNHRIYVQVGHRGPPKLRTRRGPSAGIVGMPLGDAAIAVQIVMPSECKGHGQVPPAQQM